MSKAKKCFAYNTKIIETPTTKEVYIYENPIYSHATAKSDLTESSKRKTFDEMSAHKQYDSLKRNRSITNRQDGRLPVLLIAILMTELNS